MCQQSKNNLDKFLYSNPKLSIWLEDNKLNLVSNTDDTYSELKSFLEELFGLPYEQIPTLHPYLVLWIENRIIEKNQLAIKSNFTISVKNNIYNFSLAKCFQFLNALKSLKKNETDTSQLKNYSNLVFSVQQATEEWQVEHLTTNISKIEKVNPSGETNDLLEYITERDGKVRPEHKLQDGTIRPKTDTYWNKAIGLLSEWNCRCSIEQAPNGAKLTVAPNVNTKEVNPPSDINLQTGKAIIFKETLPVFQDLDPTVRNKFRKNGF